MEPQAGRRKLSLEITDTVAGGSKKQTGNERSQYASDKFPEESPP